MGFEDGGDAGGEAESEAEAESESWARSRWDRVLFCTRRENSSWAAVDISDGWVELSRGKRERLGNK